MSLLKQFIGGQWVPVLVGETGATGPQGATGPSGTASAAGANTEVQFNDAGNLGANSNFTYNQATNTLVVNGGQIQAGNFNAGSGVVQALTGNLIDINSTTITATGNVTGQYIIGDGSLLTNINAGNITGAYGNANVSNFLATGFGSNTITTTGNITANTFVGQLNGNVIEPLQFGIENIGNPTNVTTVYGNGVGIQSYTDQDINILSTTTNSHINMVTFGSGVASDINIGALGGATANVRIRGANLNAEQNISATGNVTAARFNGNLQGKVLDSAQLGIQLIGNNSSSTSTAIYGNGISILPLAESDMFILGTGANTDIVIGGSGANANGVVIIGQNPLSSSPFLTVFNSTDIFVQGNLRNNLGNIAIIDNVDITGAISATGNVTGSYILGNGSQLTGLPATYGNANVSNFLANGFGSNNITTTGNIITGNILTDGYYYANGTPFTGSGSSYGNANVSNFLANGFGSNNITTTGNIAVDNISMTGNLTNPSGSVKIPDDIIMGTSQPVTITASTGQFKVEAQVGSYAANIYNGDSSGSGLTIQAGAGASQTILDLRNVYGVSIANVAPGNGFQLSGQILASGNITGEYFIGNGSALTGVVASGLGGNMAANISGVNLYNISGLTSLSATSVATDTISSPSGDFVTIEGVIATNGGQMSGNLAFNDQNGVVFKEGTSSGTNYVMLRSYPSLSTDTIYLLPNDGSNGQVLTTSGTGNLSWTTVSGGGGGTPGGSDTQIQFNDAGSFGGNANVTFNKTTGNMAIGNIVFASGTTNTNANNQTFNNWIQLANDHIGNSATANTYTPGRYLFGKGLGGTPGSGGIPGYFGVNVDQDGGLRNARVAIADRYTLTDTGVRNAGLMVYNWIDVSGNINSANTNTRVNGIVSALVIGGNGSGNLVSNSTNPYRGFNSSINIGTTANANVGNTIATTIVGYNSFINVNSGSELKNAVHYVAGGSSASGSTTGNSFGLVHNFSSSVAYSKIALLNMQNATGNGWGQNSTLPTTYLFLDNTDTRSSSLVGPIREYYDRPYTFVTTTGSTNLDWNNGTSQYLKPTGNVTLAFTNALTNSNGNLFHTVTLVVEQGTTPYTITLPTANATIKYAGAVSTVGATANAVIMITSTAANINGSTTYLTTVSPEFS
jgi:hypothetical protein